MKNFLGRSGGHLLLRLCLPTLFGLISLQALAQQSPPTRPAVEVTPLSLPGSEPHIYKIADQAELRLHVVKPKGWALGDSRPALIAYFGGGWTSGTPERAMGWARWAANHGMVGIAGDYRTLHRFQTTPETAVADGRSALDWVAKHSSQLGVDPRKLVSLGASSGGHVAAWTAMKIAGPGADDPMPDVIPSALVLVNPVSDTKLGGYGGPRRFDDSPARALAASVPDQMPLTMPPTIVFHGTADSTVPYANSVALCEKMRASGNRCDLVTFEGFGHSYYSESAHGEKAKLALQKTYAEMFAFLSSLGLIDSGYELQ